MRGSESWLEGYRAGYADGIQKHNELALRLDSIRKSVQAAMDAAEENSQVGDTEDGPLHGRIVAVLREWYAEDSDQQYDEIAANVLASVITLYPSGSDENE